MDNKLKRTDHRAILRIAVFGVLTVVSVALFLFGMVNNGNGAVERYDQLNAVDQAGGDVEEALTELRDYIYSHMNTEIGGPNGIYPPIQLSGTYERLIEKETARVKKANDKVYSEAQAKCEAENPAGQLQSGRVPCVQEYIDKNTVSAKSVDDSFYKFNYVAPKWSPDLAGFSLLAAVLFGFLTVFNLLIHMRTKHIINIGN